MRRLGFERMVADDLQLPYRERNNKSMRDHVDFARAEVDSLLSSADMQNAYSATSR